MQLHKKQKSFAVIENLISISALETKVN